MDAHKKTNSHSTSFLPKGGRKVMMILTIEEINLLIYQFNVESNLEHMPGSLHDIIAKFWIVQEEFQIIKAAPGT